MKLVWRKQRTDKAWLDGFPSAVWIPYGDQQIYARLANPSQLPLLRTRNLGMGQRLALRVRLAYTSCRALLR